MTEAYGHGATIPGELGDGSKLAKSAPVLVGTGYKTVAAGGSTNVALKTDGTLWAWGMFYLGDGTTSDSTVPKLIGSGYVAVDAGRVQTSP